MEIGIQILLDIWREAARHIEIRESVDRLAAIISRRLPFDLLLVQRLDPAAPSVETIAEARSGEAGGASWTRRRLSPETLEDMLAWSERREVRRSAAREIERAWPGFLPPEIRGHVLMTTLFHLGEPGGFLILVGSGRRQFQAAHEPIVEALREPFEAALAIDQQVRELQRLRSAVEADNRSLLRRLGKKALADVVVGAESGLRTVMERAVLVARSDVPVLLLGETGTGKEVIARELHRRSLRTQGPFVRVNCGAIPPELIDSELFGHEMGSFTGAVAQRKGWFERAEGGTLMLDEVAELPAAAQVRLLRVLQDGSFERVGGHETLHVSVRIVAATHRDLQAMIADGRFREDLWYRLAVFPIEIPALRDRRVDIPALAHHFALRAAHRLGLAPQLPSPEDLQLLSAYDWPGNIRELASVIDRAAILGDGRGLRVARALGLQPARSPSSGEPASSRPAAGLDLCAASPVMQPRPIPGGSAVTAERVAFEALDVAMRRHVEAALSRTGGRVEGRYGAAKLLQINANTLRGRMRKLGIRARTFREAARDA